MYQIIGQQNKKPVILAECDESEVQSEIQYWEDMHPNAEIKSVYVDEDENNVHLG